jgi:cyclin C
VSQLRFCESSSVLTRVFFGSFIAARFFQDSSLEKEAFSTAWSVINDSYFTDVVLLYPPYVIALSAVFIASIYSDKDPIPWFEKLNVNQQEVQEVVRQLLAFYHGQSSAPTAVELQTLNQRLQAIAPQPEPPAQKTTSAAQSEAVRSSSSQAR